MKANIYTYVLKEAKGLTVFFFLLFLFYLGGFMEMKLQIFFFYP